MGIDKTSIAVFLIAFWLFLPLPMMLFNVGEFREITIDESTNEISVLSSVPATYFDLLIFNIPNANFWLLRFINFLQLMTLLVAYLLIREG